MQSSELDSFASQMSYLAPIKYISGRIVEYDIFSANITMLRKYGKIDDNYYQYLCHLPKTNREIEVGLLIRSDKSYYDTIRDGIIEAKKLLFRKNSINPNNIVRIANDAVYINQSTDLIYTQFDDVLFRQKSISNVMMTLGKLIIFFWYNDNGINIDVKGMSEESQILHLDYMLSTIASTIHLIEKSSIQDAITYFINFYDKYINLKLPIEYYRELSPESLYHYKNSEFYLMNIDDINRIDINYNLYLIRELWLIIFDKYRIMTNGG